MGKTVEERLAELEAAVKKLQPAEAPAQYYTSKYSGEEIDALLDVVSALNVSIN